MGVSIFTVVSVVSANGSHRPYNGAVSVTSTDEPQLATVNLLQSAGPTALTGHNLVETLPKPYVLSVEDTSSSLDGNPPRLMEVPTSRPEISSALPLHRLCAFLWEPHENRAFSPSSDSPTAWYRPSPPSPTHLSQIQQPRL